MNPTILPKQLIWPHIWPPSSSRPTNILHTLLTLPPLLPTCVAVPKYTASFFFYRKLSSLKEIQNCITVKWHDYSLSRIIKSTLNWCQKYPPSTSAWRGWECPGTSWRQGRDMKSDVWSTTSWECCSPSIDTAVLPGCSQICWWNNGGRRLDPYGKNGFSEHDTIIPFAPMIEKKKKKMHSLQTWWCTAVVWVLIS